MRTDKPSIRVTRAMNRLTRNKYMPPYHVDIVGFNLSRLASIRSCGGGGAHTIFRYSIKDECRHSGMINGKPPFDLVIERSAHLELLKFLREYANKGKRKLNYELQLLRIRSKYT